jgi:signal transduction histidine kinase
MAATYRTATLLFEESLLSAYDAFFHSFLRFAADKTSWDSLARLIADQLACESCSIFLSDDQDTLTLKGATGMLGSPRYDDIQYRKGEGLTGYALQQDRPLLYHRELAMRYKSIHVSKYRERQGKSNSILFGQLQHSNGQNIGVIRCSHKREVQATRLGRFTQEDVSAIDKICRVISGIFSKVQLVRDKELEQERSFRSLHHEIVSPVDGIMAHVEWIERHIERAPPNEWNVHRLGLKFSDLKQIAKVLENAVFLMGPFSEEMNLQLQPVQVSKLLTTCLGFILNEARQNDVRVDAEGVHGSLRVEADESQMMRVFYNLIRNAVKYNDRKEPNRYIRLFVTDDLFSGHVVVTVEDNGIGVPAGEECRIFEKFRRGSNARLVAPVGEGLGLYYCQTIVNRHGGTIRVGQRGKPTRFIVSLPKAGHK